MRLILYRHGMSMLVLITESSPIMVFMSDGAKIIMIDRYVD